MSAKDQMRIANKLRGEKVSVVINAISEHKHIIENYHYKVLPLGGKIDAKC